MDEANPQPRGWITSSTVLLVIGAACFLLASPCAFLGVLGFLGIVADVSPAENRQFGWQFLTLAAVPAAVGLVVLGVAVATSWRKRT